MLRAWTFLAKELMFAREHRSSNKKKVENLKRANIITPLDIKTKAIAIKNWDTVKSSTNVDAHRAWLVLSILSLPRSQ